LTLDYCQLGCKGSTIMNFSNNILKIIIASLFFVAISVFAGEVYEWQDESGKWHFSDNLNSIPLKYRNRFEIKLYKEKTSPHIPKTDEPKKEENKKIKNSEDTFLDEASILQKGIEIIGDEIQRDELVTSRMMTAQGFRQIKILLKKDLILKEKLVNDLKSVLISTLPNEIESLRRTLEQEREIVQQPKINSIKIRRMVRLNIKESIPIKKKIIASFEKLLSDAPLNKIEPEKINAGKIKYEVMSAFEQRLNLWRNEEYEKLYFYGTDASKLSLTKEKFIKEMEAKAYTLQCCNSMVSDINVNLVSPLSAVVTAKVGYVIKNEYRGILLSGGVSLPHDLAKNIYRGTTITQTFRMTLEEGSWRMSHSNILYPRASKN